MLIINNFLTLTDQGRHYIGELRDIVAEPSWMGLTKHPLVKDWECKCLTTGKIVVSRDVI